MSAGPSRGFCPNRALIHCGADYLLALDHGERLFNRAATAASGSLSSE